jgi:hypothetical protein
LAALILSVGFAADEIHARTLVNPITQPGDPDEFESRTGALPPGEAGKPALCGNSLFGESGTEVAHVPSDVPRDDGRAGSCRCEKIISLIRWMIAEMALKLSAL